MNYVWAATEESLSVGVNTGAWHAISSASPIVQLTLLLLVVMSVVSWAIIAAKSKQLRTIRAANQPFLDKFWKASSLDEIFENISEFEKSSMASVFRSGYLELRKIADSNLAMNEQSQNAMPSLSGIDNLERALEKSIQSQVGHMEGRLSFLATTGSTGPFIGLFGTVWGIMGSFQKIGATGMASLAVVAPGIAEALIATAMGLAAAIPATVAYNHYLAQIKKEELEMSNFVSDFLNIAKRNFFKER